MPTVASFSHWLLDIYFQSSVLLLAAVAAHSMVRQPVRRQIISWSASLGLLVLVLASLIPSSPTARLLDAGVLGLLPVSWQSPLAFGFVGGGSVTALWLIGGMMLTRRLVRRAEQAAPSVMAVLSEVIDAKRRPPRLRVTDSVAQPAAADIRRPAILLPRRSATSSSGADLRMLLAHEWNHICRGDLALLGLGRLLTVVFFAQPLFWWLRHRIDLDQEYLADDAAARRSDPVAYAELLLRWSIPGRSGSVGLPVLAFARGRRLKRRLRMLLEPSISIDRRLSKPWCCGVSVFTLLILAILSTLGRPLGSAADAVATATSDAASVVRVDANSIQELIDSSPSGSQLLLAPGEYRSPVSLSKSLRLKAEPGARFLVTSDRPAIAIVGDGDAQVEIEGLTIEWQRESSQPAEKPPAAIRVEDANASIRNCRVMALGNNTRCPVGVSVSGVSEVDLSGCRLEGFEFTVQYWNGAEGMVTNCIVSGPGHCGITVGRDSTVKVIRNVVTGSRFHGIRCTGGTLVARDNLVIKNSNRGIYLGNNSASGEVINNLIVDNETGISAFAQTDVAIRNNVLLRSGYAGLATRDTCSLKVSGNVFQGNTRGVIVFAEAGASRLTFQTNTFWDNRTNSVDLNLSDTELIVDPRFADIENGAFSIGASDLEGLGQGLTDATAPGALWVEWRRDNSP